MQRHSEYTQSLHCSVPSLRLCAIMCNYVQLCAIMCNYVQLLLNRLGSHQLTRKEGCPPHSYMFEAVGTTISGFLKLQSGTDQNKLIKQVRSTNALLHLLVKLCKELQQEIHSQTWRKKMKANGLQTQQPQPSPLGKRARHTAVTCRWPSLPGRSWWPVSS